MNIGKNKWLAVGLACIALGYLLLISAESMSVAPTLLVGGYCVFIPLHLWSRYRTKNVGE